jgi:hypothetical protein
MNYFLNSLVLVACTMLALTCSSVAAFAPGSMASRRPSFLSAMAPMPASVASPTMMTQLGSDTQMMRQVDLNAGIENYLLSADSAAADSSISSSMTLSLQERVAPTKEEIANKKNTFNLIFWGGGIGAPFIATFFYFGFKFWEK